MFFNRKLGVLGSGFIWRGFRYRVILHQKHITKRLRQKRYIMKKELLLSVLMVMMPLMANAYDAEIDGIYYNFSGSEASVTYRDSQYANYSGSVTIPESVTYNGKTYSVTGINGWAFAYCSELNSITSPNSVTSIGDFAFNMCRVLSSVVIPNGVKSIGYQTFGHCLALTSVIIPNSVTSIGTRAFDNYGNLQSATIPTSVTEIIMGAFRRCNKLTDINYAGTRDQWEAITVQPENDCLQNASLHCLTKIQITDKMVSTIASQTYTGKEYNTGVLCSPGNICRDGKRRYQCSCNGSFQSGTDASQDTGFCI